MDILVNRSNFCGLLVDCLWINSSLRDIMALFPINVRRKGELLRWS